MGRIWLVWGCIFGFLTVAMGAFATHSFQSLLPVKNLQWIATGNTYMAYHAFALLALGLWSHWEKWASNVMAGCCFVLGIVLFTGSLYGLAFTGIKTFVFITPVGGSLFLLGWIFFAISIYRTRNPLV